jgi:hypothetical protein
MSTLRSGFILLKLLTKEKAVSSLSSRILKKTLPVTPAIPEAHDQLPQLRVIGIPTPERTIWETHNVVGFLQHPATNSTPAIAQCN